MANKSRLMFLMKYMEQNTDEKNTISSVQLKQILIDEGYKADNRTVKDDMETLREAGIDIAILERNGVPTRYYMKNRLWSTAELKTMIYALEADRTVSANRKQDIIHRLVDLAPISDRRTMRPDKLAEQSRKRQQKESQSMPGYLYRSPDGAEDEPLRRVTLRCSAQWKDRIREYFGPDVEILNENGESFEVAVIVASGETLFSWLFRYADALQIVEPEDVRETYRKRLEKALQSMKD